jgi:hypothetical protein
MNCMSTCISSSTDVLLVLDFKLSINYIINHVHNHNIRFYIVVSLYAYKRVLKGVSIPIFRPKI